MTAARTLADLTIEHGRCGYQPLGVRPRLISSDGRRRRAWSLGGVRSTNQGLLASTVSGGSAGKRSVLMIGQLNASVAPSSWPAASNGLISQISR
jgi:hypothetical protein